MPDLFCAPCPQIIHRDRFPRTERFLLLQEGVLRPCGRHFRAAGVPECSELRATVLRLDLPKALGVRGRTAAWVWWGGDPPAWPPELFVRVNGFNALPLRWRGLGIGVLPREQPGDVVVCAGLRLTSPERTVRDIAIRADAR